MFPSTPKGYSVSLNSFRRTTSHRPRYIERCNSYSEYAVTKIRDTTFPKISERVMRYQFFTVPSTHRTAGDRPLCKVAVAGPLLRSEGEGDVIILQFGHANKDVFELALEIQRVGGVCLRGLGVADLCVVVIRHQDFEVVFSIRVDHHNHLRNGNAADPLCVGRRRRRRP